MSVALAALFLQAAAAPPDPIPEGVHATVLGTPDICGVSGATVAAIKANLLRDDGIEEMLFEEHYETYRRPRYAQFWTFTTESHPAYPAIVCRTVLPGDGSIVMEIVCSDDRSDCDRLYRDFEAHNREVVSQAETE